MIVFALPPAGGKLCEAFLTDKEDRLPKRPVLFAV